VKNVQQKQLSWLTDMAKEEKKKMAGLGADRRRYGGRG